MAPSQHPVYPPWPSSPADLVPLPMIDGPKLKPFDFRGGPQDIEFLECLGQGLHGCVVKIRIHGQEYAMKIFRFVDPSDWGVTHFQMQPQEDYRDWHVAVAPYVEPFYKECRAFGRLQETGRTDLAIDCFGYVLLDEANERALDALNICDQETGYDDWAFKDCRSEFSGPDDRPPPIRGIVKALGRADDLYMNLPRADARRLLDDVMQMHQLGMVYLDVKRGQFIDWKFADFSTTITTPHFLTSPEIAAGTMEISPVARAVVEYELFIYCLNDYHDYELRTLFFHPPPHAATRKQVDRLDFFFTFGRTRYALRSAPRHRTLPYTLADPRHFDWRAPRAAAAAAGLATRPKTSARTRMARLPRWYYPTHETAERYLNELSDLPHFVGWDVRDGCIYPTKNSEACRKLSLLLKNSGGNLDMSVAENKELVEADKRGRYLLDETFVAPVPYWYTEPFLSKQVHNTE